jgi:hypothetical protein
MQAEHVEVTSRLASSLPQAWLDWAVEFRKPAWVFFVVIFSKTTC